MALDDHEGERVAKLLGDDHSVLMLGNHGVIVIGETVARAFDELYYLERAAELQVLALSTGRRLAVIDDETAQLACAASGPTIPTCPSTTSPPCARSSTRRAPSTGCERNRAPRRGRRSITGASVGHSVGAGLVG